MDPVNQPAPGKVTVFHPKPGTALPPDPPGRGSRVGVPRGLRSGAQLQTTHTACGSLNFPTCWMWYMRSPPLTYSMTKYSRS